MVGGIPEGIHITAGVTVLSDGAGTGKNGLPPLDNQPIAKLMKKVATRANDIDLS